MTNAVPSKAAITVAARSNVTRSPKKWSAIVTNAGNVNSSSEVSEAGIDSSAVKYAAVCSAQKTPSAATTGTFVFGTISFRNAKTAPQRKSAAKPKRSASRVVTGMPSP